ncbi:LysR family transcriptional regulator [Kitasatospora sp. MMS16-BH015]|uniref:LysR family transcriptional regulator n=1 Tax=Kitasatospora sp. MMS16-BH015 TaxID=2018025 RepID=UPI000CA20C1E|nr:LysR substrate-binding domain-containing protein [Kitasatospora sp. MMS16-BH015]AUG78526.1 LysR family transcriptional regulator [Kitasatospora sp. MMS16-BH015]
MLERHEVEALLALAEELHFGRTAERLHVSTANVSQTIRKVERRVGVPLFRRTSRVVELTPVGRRLVEELAPAWSAVGTAVERAVAAGRGLDGRLEVAFVGAAAGQLVIGAVEAFRERAPGCEVRIREAQPAELLPWLRSGEVELGLGVLAAAEPGIACGRPLVREAQLLAVPVTHPFADRGAGVAAAEASWGVSVAELAGVPLVRLAGQGAGLLGAGAGVGAGAEAEAGEGGTGVGSGPVAGTFHEALTLVGAGQGLLAVGGHARRYYARPDIAYVPLRDAPSVEWGLMWPAERATARVRAFVEAAAGLVGAVG